MSNTNERENYNNQTRTFSTTTGIFLAANAADLLTTFVFLAKGYSEGNNWFENINPMLSPRYLTENYGFEALIIPKLVGCALIVGSLFLLRSQSEDKDQQFVILLTRFCAMVVTAVAGYNAIAPLVYR